MLAKKSLRFRFQLDVSSGGHVADLVRGGLVIIICVVILKQRGGVCLIMKRVLQLSLTVWGLAESHRGMHKPTPPAAVLECFNSFSSRIA